MWIWGKVEERDTLIDFRNGPDKSNIAKFPCIPWSRVYLDKSEAISDMTKAAHRDIDCEYCLFQVVGKMTATVPHMFTEVEG